MKKKLAMLLALVLAFGGTSAALLTSCKPTDNPNQDVQENEYKVRFLKEDGTLIEEKTVKHGEKVEAVTAPEKAGCIHDLRTQPASVLPEGKGNYFMERS